MNVIFLIFNNYMITSCVSLFSKLVGIDIIVCVVNGNHFPLLEVFCPVIVISNFAPVIQF